MPFFEQRVGVVLADPLLAVLPPVDLTLPIFLVLYCTLVAALFILARSPERFAHALRAYGAMVLVRIVTLWAAPLDPPHGMVLLNDPVASMGPGGALTRDLFFSGHTATLVLMALILPWRSARIATGCLAIIMAVMLLLQHVHYTIDIVVAPFVAWGALTLTRRRQTRASAPPSPAAP